MFHFRSSKMLFSRPLLAFLTTFSLIVAAAYGAFLLPETEVEALREIGKTIGKRDWNFSADPCGGEWGWADPPGGPETNDLENAVTCNCSFSNTTVCHVVSIVLKTQNLQGTLPVDLGGLPYLQEIDLTRNYLNGTIPSEWGSTQLVNISLLVNRLTGPIPKEIGNISTLVNFTVEFNQLSGSLPKELGNLIRLEKMHLTSNYFSGQLPETFAQLAALKDFRVGGNNLTGQMPNFIQNWTNLQKLVMIGSGLSGPIPPGIASLVNMTDLRISDLSNGPQTFPPLSTMTNLKTLLLRSCNIIGKLPDYLGGMSKLKTLDLSFNRLNGTIPSSYSGLEANHQYIYLTANQLRGTVPDWILRNGKDIDLSYNNFTIDGPCQQRTINLFETTDNASKLASCLGDYRCPKTFYSFHINCGGREVITNGLTYEEDTDAAGQSRFYQSRTNWAFSSTGDFLDDNRPTDSYIWKNTSMLTANISSLYTTARLTPITLTYYGFCMANGSYTVSLQFAEIMFAADNTYSSLGRRYFDIYVQGKLVEKDFNIEDEAGGFGRPVIKNYTANVGSGTLEIRFYWAGKGTTGVPFRGVYGPLISAISVTSDFPAPSEGGTGNGLSAGSVAGIVIGVLAAIFTALSVFWWIWLTKRKNAMDKDLKGIDLKTGKFTLRQIKAATNNFDPTNKIGEGGFGPVYKGLLSDGSIIAVKQLSSKSRQGNREFINEIGMISALQHPNLVKLYGCCIEGNQLLLVYEYMENNSLARALFGAEQHQLMLDWPTRHKICVGIARGLAYLHEESRLKIVHRDIKATNVLLDGQLSPKISDFGLAKLDDEANTHMSTRIAGTFGYMAPEYAMRGHLSDKADVYSFGIVALEIVSGMSNTSYRTKTESFYLVDWVHVLKEKGALLDLVDSKLGNEYNKGEVMTMINVALLCTNVSPTARPTMSSIVSMLEGMTDVDDLDMESSVSSDLVKIEEMKKHFQHIKEKNTNESQTHSMSLEGPYASGSSTSAVDLYPVHLDSAYWNNRDRENS